MYVDLSVAYEVIDLYAEMHLRKPNSGMTRSQFIAASHYMIAIDTLKEYLKTHWFEAAPSDLVYNFVKEYDKRRKLMKNDILQRVIYMVSKEILYYFL